ncbi:kinase-like protein [Auricularia subglabra TFB-10046 SS5]|uniref:Kinase-like protein n=1 Tax=Auricularia subglabra (strain TFB-10046 / SS5) TaxID=717982 RepID=J0LCZ4_AURST|nr:kinase-like protein [Auricularia subglabra TFB-10046 SS5]
MRRILPFIGVASMQFQMIIASKFMRNGNLLQYFNATPGADRQHLVTQVAEGVYWLHEFKGLVHGDLKCENVLINDDGDAVLADFGLATLIEQEASDITTISAIRVMNTLPFAAPEIAFPKESKQDRTSRPRSKTCASDVYAFGMLILQVS